MPSAVSHLWLPVTWFNEMSLNKSNKPHAYSYLLRKKTVKAPQQMSRALQFSDSVGLRFRRLGQGKYHFPTVTSSWFHSFAAGKINWCCHMFQRSWATTEMADFPHVKPVCSNINRQRLHISMQKTQRNQESAFLLALEKTVSGITLSYNTTESATVPKKQTVIALLCQKEEWNIRASV